MVGVVAHVGERHLVGPERALDGHAVDDLGAGPPLRRAQHDRGPAGAGAEAVRAGTVLDRLDRVEAPVERRCEVAVHGRGVVTLDEVHVVPVTLEHGRDRVVRCSPEHGRAGDLVAVEMEDGQHRAVAHGVEEVDPLPRARQRSGLGLTVTDDARDDEIRVVERGAERVDERVAELATLVDRPRCRNAHVARHAAGRRELPEQPAHAVVVLRHHRVHLAVGAFEVHVGEDGGATVTGAGDEDDVGVAIADDPVEVRVQEAETGRRAPVPEQAWLDVLGRSGSRSSALSQR